MCLNPRKIINPKRKFSQVGGHPLYLLVPCGHCAECLKRKQDEYQLRSYYEALSTFNAGGFVLFDTLTFSNKTIPHISDFDETLKGSNLDFPCFSQECFRLFMVRLRTSLYRLGYDVKNNLKYFMAAEYGTSENHSHRPHYHIVFFVNNPNLPPLTFSKIVSDCWTYGRTDGVPYKSTTYVLSKRVFSKSINSDLVHLQNVTFYITKYMVKDSRFDSVLRSRVNSILVRKFGKNSTDSPDSIIYKKWLLRKVSQFHRNSNYFGLSAFKYNNPISVKANGYIVIPDKHQVLRKIPLPVYFQRKLFYTLTRDFRGERVWTLTPEGIQNKINKASSISSALSDTLSGWFKNLPIISDGSLSERVLSLLDGRSFKDFADYLIYYRGRLLPYYQHLETDRLSKLDCPAKELMITCAYEDESICSAYLSHADDKLRPTLVTFGYYHDDKYDTRTDVLDNRFANDYTSATTLSAYSKRLITQDTYHEFRYFDTLFNLYTSSLILTNKKKQNAFDIIQRTQDAIRSLKFNFINPLNN